MLKGKSLLDYTDLFSSNKYEKNDKIIPGCNKLRRMHTYAKETNSLPDLRGKLYCSMLAYTL